jgi:hypothetical protein
MVDIPAEIRVISDAIDTKMTAKAITKRSTVAMLHDQKMYYSTRRNVPVSVVATFYVISHIFHELRVA